MRRARIGICLAALAGLAAAVPQAMAQPGAPAGTAFTYQGRLDDGGQPANGIYDLQFQLGTSIFGVVVGSPVTVENVSVVNGLFTTKLDFGQQFNGDARFVEVRVRPGASTGAFTPLTPRQELTPAPYAIGLSLPFSAAQTETASLFTLDQNGTGKCMTLTGTDGDCLDVSSDGNGEALYAHSSGFGSAIFARTFGTNGATYALNAVSSNGSTPLFAYNLGPSSYAGLFRSESSTNASNCVEIQQNGTGPGLKVNARAARAGWFENTNASNANAVLVADNVGGTASAVYGKTSGLGRAGAFDIINASNSLPALDASTMGSGPAVEASTSGSGPAIRAYAGSGLAGQFYGDVTVNGELKAEVGGQLNRATLIAWGRFTADSHDPVMLASSGNVTVQWLAGEGYRVQVSGETEP